MSDLSKKMIGTYIADDPSPKPPLKSWLQAECRRGKLRPFVDRFIENQDELLDGSLVIVDAVEEDCLVCRIPCRLFDHESPGTFASEVTFTVNPVTGAVRRTN